MGKMFGLFSLAGLLIAAPAQAAKIDLRGTPIAQKVNEGLGQLAMGNEGSSKVDDLYIDTDTLTAKAQFTVRHKHRWVKKQWGQTLYDVSVYDVTMAAGVTYNFATGTFDKANLEFGRLCVNYTSPFGNLKIDKMISAKPKELLSPVAASNNQLPGVSGRTEAWHDRVRGATEQFRVINLGGDRVAIQCRSTGGWLCCDGTSVFGNRASPQVWETWRKVSLPDGKFALRAHTGKLFCVSQNGRPEVTRSSIGPWETLTAKPADGEWIAIRSWKGYLCALP